MAAEATATGSLGDRTTSASTAETIASSSRGEITPNSGGKITSKETPLSARAVRPGMLAKSEPLFESAGFALVSAPVTAKGQGANTFPASTFYSGSASPGGPSVPATPSSQAPSNDPVAQQVEEIVSKAKKDILSRPHHSKAASVDSLLDLIGGYSASSDEVKKKLLAYPGTKEVLDESVATLTQTLPGQNLSEAASYAFDMLNSIMEAENPYLHFDPAIKYALLTRVVEGTEHTKLLFSSLSPDAQIAFNELVYKDVNFIKLPLETCFALLSQISNYPSERTISKLKLLVDKPGLDKQSLDNQRRSVRFIAIASQYGDKETLDKTFNVLLHPNGPIWEWTDLEANVCEYRGDVILLNRDWMTASNRNVVSDREIHLATHTSTYAGYHAKYKTRAVPTYLYFRGEYLARYYGHKGEHHGARPNEQWALFYIKELISKNKIIADTLKNKPIESKKILDFIIGMFNLNPATTIDDILKLNPMSLSDKPAPPPAVIDGWPDDY
jgi:hypothetical protein